MKFLYLLVFVLLTSCTSKYIGTSNPIYDEFGCPLSEEACTLSYGGISTAYKVLALEDNQYQVAGVAQWDNKKCLPFMQKSEDSD